VSGCGLGPARLARARHDELAAMFLAQRFAGEDRAQSRRVHELELAEIEHDLADAIDAQREDRRFQVGRRRDVQLTGQLQRVAAAARFVVQSSSPGRMAVGVKARLTTRSAAPMRPATR
jgi:hypothetical protein